MTGGFDPGKIIFMNKIKLISIVLWFASLLAACSSQAAVEPVEYTVVMSEYAFAPNTFEVKVGQKVTFNLVNEGALAHEIMIGRDVMMMDAKPAGYQHDLFEQSGVHPQISVSQQASAEHGAGHSGTMVVLPTTGSTGTLSFTATKEMAGEWEIGCFELDGVHYAAGMVGKLVVTP